MINLLQEKWNRLKDQIEQLKPHADVDPSFVMQIRKLKNEASVLKFAIEDLARNKSTREVLHTMRENRESYRKLWNY